MKKRMNRIMAGFLSAALVAGICANDITPVMAATEHWNDASTDSAEWASYKASWETISQNYGHVSLTPGEDETQLNFAWYSKTAETPQVRFATSEAALESAAAVSGTQEDISATVEGYFSNKVTITGLTENTDYYYQVFQDGAWQAVQNYSTQSFSNYSILYVGDPQIGACKSQTSSENEAMSESDANLAARNDSFNWNNVLNNAMSAHPDVSFLISAGDQVNTANKEEEYAGYLGAEALSSLPVATTIGNHDSKSAQYSYHYNNPNAFATTDTAYTEGMTAAGTDYYYTYGDVLFIVLDTNNYNCSTHENVIKKAVEENSNAKWRVVTFHQDIYGSGYDHSDSDGIVLRTQLTPIMDKYDVDVVLQGHDHTYSRSYQLTSDGAQHTAYDKNNYREDADFLTQNNCYTITSDTVSGTVVDPEGTLYLEANSATGSKFYNLIPTQQDYISERSQTWSPSYSVIDVTDNSLTVTTYDAETNAVMEGSSSYTIVKEADKAALTAAIQDAEAKADDTDNYTKDSIKALTKAIVKAQNVADDQNATETEVAQAVADLSKAVAALSAKQSQNISATQTYNKTYGCKDFKLKASAKGKLHYYSSNTSVASVSSTGKVSVKGTGKVTITVTADATGSYQSAAKKVTIVVAPAKATVATVKSTSARSMNVTWKADKKASGYEISYSRRKSFKSGVKTVSVSKSTTTSKTIKSLNSKKKYYVRVRAYKNISGKKVYGAYSTIKSVTVK